MFPFEKIFFLSEYEVCLYRKDDAVCYSIALYPVTVPD